MDNCIVVPVKDLVSGMIAAEDIRDNRGRLLLRAGKEVKHSMIEKIREFNISSVSIYLKMYDTKEIITLQPKNDYIFREVKIDKPNKVYINKEKEFNIFNVFFIQLSSLMDKVIREMLRPDINYSGVKKRILRVLCNKNLLNLLMSLRVKDQYLLKHSVEVGVLSALIGEELCLDQEGMKKLILAAIFHDIGMTEIRNNILYKNLPLTPEELEVINSHTARSVILLKQYLKMDSEILEIVYQHHERFDGTGYPRGLKENIITNSARILAVCDVYSAISNQRSYRDRFSPQERLEFFFASGNYYFDYEIVKILLDKVSIYFRGQWVKLNTGHIGIITAVNTSLPTRPYVRLVYDENGNLMPRSKEVFLGDRNSSTIFIEKTI